MCCVMQSSASSLVFRFCFCPHLLLPTLCPNSHTVLVHPILSRSHFSICFSLYSHGILRCGIYRKGDEWTSGRRDDGAKKGGKRGSKGSKPDWHGDKDKGGIGNKGKGKGKGKCKSETRCCFDCGEQGHTGVNCPYKWANSIDEEHDQTSSWESEPEGEKLKNPRAWGAALRRAESPGGRRRTMKVSKRPED